MMRRMAMSVAVMGSALLTGCVANGGDAAETTRAHDGGGAVDVDTTAPLVAPADPDSLLQPGALATVLRAPAYQWAGPGGRPFDVAIRTADPASPHARRFGTVTLNTSLRTRAPNVGQYPCTSCHFGRRVEMRDDRIADAHRNIRPQHPTLTGAMCSTCHAPDNVEMLALRSGERATLDHTYRLCAQCHFVQAESWGNGAHGKRLDGWQGQRVVMGCADCHDPHNPSIEKRIPFRAPRLERTRRPEP